MTDRTLGEMLEHTRAEVKRTQNRLRWLRKHGETSGPEYWELRHHLLRTQTLRDTLRTAVVRLGPDAKGFDPGNGRYE